MKHASLMPVTSLMKAEDFLGKEALNSDHSGRSTSGKRPAHLISKVNEYAWYLLNIAEHDMSSA